jgi:hypothetical protein
MDSSAPVLVAVAAVALGVIGASFARAWPGGLEGRVAATHVAVSLESAECAPGNRECAAGGDNFCAACAAAGGTLVGGRDQADCVCREGRVLQPMSLPWEEECTARGVAYVGDVGRYCRGGGGLMPPALPLPGSRPPTARAGAGSGATP